MQPRLGLSLWMVELVWDKYCRAHHVPCVTLFYVLVWLKHYPFKTVLPLLGPQHLKPIGKDAAWRHVRAGLRNLDEVMVEIDEAHFRHKNNSVPHFPFTIGSWDTFPILVPSGKGRFQPKYKASVVKFQGITNHLGLFAFISGPHPGAMSDTTLARMYRPNLTPTDVILADLAYLSVPNCSTLFKKANSYDLDRDEMEFNRVHRFYRARVEHQFGHLHGWKLVSSKYRSPHMGPLKWGVRVLCHLHNMKLGFRCGYMPYTPIKPTARDG